MPCSLSFPLRSPRVPVSSPAPRVSSERIGACGRSFLAAGGEDTGRGQVGTLLCCGLEAVGLRALAALWVLEYPCCFPVYARGEIRAEEVAEGHGRPPQACS